VVSEPRRGYGAAVHAGLLAAMAREGRQYGAGRGAAPAGPAGS
jgi:hypothetical protein